MFRDASCGRCLTSPLSPIPSSTSVFALARIANQVQGRKQTRQHGRLDYNHILSSCSQVSRLQHATLALLRLVFRILVASLLLLLLQPRRAMVEPTTSRLIGSLLFLILAHNFIPLITASHDPKLVGVTIDGERYSARDDRRPALYTVDFGDCLGASLLNVTRFDAAYYKDNMTMLFQLQGETALVKEDVMMSIAVHAYGETQFELTFNPCNANIWRSAILCIPRFT